MKPLDRIHSLEAEIIRARNANAYVSDTVLHMVQEALGNETSSDRHGSVRRDHRNHWGTLHANLSAYLMDIQKRRMYFAQHGTLVLDTLVLLEQAGGFARASDGPGYLLLV